VKRQRPPRSARAEEHEGHLVAAASEEAVTTMRVAGEEGEGGFSGGRLPTGGGKNRLWVEVEMMRSLWLHRTG
jgi:hypothetical protein